MHEDDILREIWDYREAYARRFNDDVDAIMADLRARQEAEGRPVVRSVADYQAAQAKRSSESVAAETPVPVPHDS